ncbi:hypothetical protein [Priestia megaterium]|nr:hypothetical protein [Priestia megaterium]
MNSCMTFILQQQGYEGGILSITFSPSWNSLRLIHGVTYRFCISITLT